MRQRGKPIATRVTLAPKGSAVFESVDEARLRGVCRERLPAQKGYGGRGEAEPHGTIELTPEAPPAGDGAAEPAAAAAAEAELLPFFRGDLTAKMQPQPLQRALVIRWWRKLSRTLCRTSQTLAA